MNLKLTFDLSFGLRFIIIILRLLLFDTIRENFAWISSPLFEYSRGPEMSL